MERNTPASSRMDILEQEFFKGWMGTQVGSRMPFYTNNQL